MSQENVEIVRRGLGAFNRGDLEGALAMYDPSVEVKTLLSGSAHGLEQVRTLVEEREKVVAGVQYVPDDLIDAGDTIVGIVRAIGTSRLTGLSHTDFGGGSQIAFVWTLRDGLVTRQEMFGSKAEAFEAAGLRE